MGNFISSLLAAKLSGVVKLQTAVKVRIANGEILQGVEALPQCQWTCQGASFLTDMKIIPLHCYDVILGMEWLKTNSPMNVDWEAKWMEVKQEGHKHILHGLRADTSSFLATNTTQLHLFDSIDAVLFLVQVYAVEEVSSKPIPEVVQQLIHKYNTLFQEPTGLPLKRLYDHKIPLLPRATPVKQKPYRYNPMQKNEIEKQVK